MSEGDISNGNKREEDPVDGRAVDVARIVSTTTAKSINDIFLSLRNCHPLQPDKNLVNRDRANY